MATIDPNKHYGNPGASLPPEVQADIIERCRRGETRNGIAEELKVGRAAVSGIVQRAGLTFERAKETQTALEARRADLAKRRTAIIDRGYRRLEATFDRLEAAKFQTVLKTTGGAEEVRELDFVPTVDERNLADVLARYVTSLARLEMVDADRPAESATNLLTDLGVALGIVQPE